MTSSTPYDDESTAPAMEEEEEEQDLFGSMEHLKDAFDSFAVNMDDAIEGLRDELREEDKAGPPSLLDDESHSTASAILSEHNNNNNNNNNKSLLHYNHRNKNPNSILQSSRRKHTTNSCILESTRTHSLYKCHEKATTASTPGGWISIGMVFLLGCLYLITTTTTPTIQSILLGLGHPSPASIIREDDTCTRPELQWDPALVVEVPKEPEPTLTVRDLGPLPTSTLGAVQESATTPQALAFDWLQSDPHWPIYSFDRRRQRFALATLYFATNPVHQHVWSQQGHWLSYSVHECEWMNDNQHGRVNLCASTYSTEEEKEEGKTIKQLPLQNNNLVGHLPPELSLLVHLEELRLDGNQQLEGPVPEAWGMSFQVHNFQRTYWEPRRINLQDTKLIGKVPDEHWCYYIQDLKFDCKRGGAQHGVCGCGCLC